MSKKPAQTKKEIPQKTQGSLSKSNQSNPKPQGSQSQGSPTSASPKSEAPKSTQTPKSQATPKTEVPKSGAPPKTPKTPDTPPTPKANTPKAKRSSPPATNSPSSTSLVGVTPNGTHFLLPKTKSALHFSFPHKWTVFEWIKYLVCFFQISLLYFDLSPQVYIGSFIFWRLAYNLGLGFLLHKQSKERGFSSWFKTLKPGPFFRKVIAGEMPDDYKYDSFPHEFNAWLLFRGITEVILAADLVSYGVLCFKYINLPESFSLQTVITYAVGIFLALFALWAKVDAYRVIKDYAWFWGDFFFLVDQKLVFNRVFSLFPHPMYTVGYAFFYGAWIISQNETILYVSLVGHFCQLLFLQFVETPHIEKTYPEMVKEVEPKEQEVFFNKKTGYYRGDLIFFKNIDLMRSSDVFLLLCVAYVVVLHMVDGPIAYYIGHAIFWRVFHSYVLGYVLHKQSKTNFWNNHFTTKRTKHEGFEEWKRFYNSSLTMTYVSMISVSLKLLIIIDFDRMEILRLVFGSILIALNIWSSVSTFEVLGENGWFYGDFFISEVPSKLYYTGIYRYLNNPDSVTGFAAFYGFFLISGSWIVLGLAIFSQTSHLLFLTYVEVPHMRILYGDSLREKAGFEEGVKAIIDEEKSKISERVKEVKQKAEKVVVDVKRAVLSRSSSFDSF